MFFTNTSRYPTTTVAALVTFVLADLDLADVAINVKNCSHAYAGRAYHPVPQISPWSGNPGVHSLIVLRLGGPTAFPCDNLTTTIRKKPLTDWLSAEQTFPAGPDIRYERRGRGRSQRWRAVRVTVARHPYGGKTSPLIEMETWQECLIALAAHEARHIVQFRTHARKSEVECERYAAARLAEYRATQAAAAS